MIGDMIEPGTWIGSPPRTGRPSWWTAPLWLLCLHSAQAQLVINEVCSRNSTVLEDAAGRHPDWIELFNAGGTAVDLGQYHLSDRIMQPGMWPLPALELGPGEYVVFMQGEPADGPMYFPFGISGEGESVFLSDASLVSVSSLDVPTLRADHSFGRHEQGTAIFMDPTPGGPNTTTAYAGYAAMPWPDPLPGFRQPGETMVLMAEQGHAIHYTLDNTDPNTGSSLYHSAISLESNTVVKAIAIAPGLVPSEVFTGTYLVNAHRRLPTLSITTHPDSLFHDTLGIYDTGPFADPEFPYWGANFWSNRHIPVHVEFFDENGHLGLSQKVDLRMHGGTQARTKPQRPFRLTARGRYGDARLRNPFFPERGANMDYKHLVLRNASNDFSRAHFRDAYWHRQVMRDKLDIDAIAYRPVQVFVNGAYWGVMNLRERLSAHYLAQHYDVDRDRILMMEDENTPIIGDTMPFLQLKEFILQHDLNDPVHWAALEEQLDIPSYKDYFATEIFAGNVDWPANNVRYWKPSAVEGKWRYLLHDLDATMYLAEWIPMEVDMFWWVLEHREGWTHSEIFRALLANHEFRRTFINRLADLMNTTFSPGSMQETMAGIRATIGPDMPHHFLRWDVDINLWRQHAEGILPLFARTRQDYVRDHVLDRFELPSTTALRWEVFPPGAGEVRINTIAPEMPFEGVYFSDNPIDLWAEAAPGFVFDHWQHDAVDEDLSEGAFLRYDPTLPGKITAYFRRPGEELMAFPNPFTEQVELGIVARRHTRADIAVHDSQGRVVAEMGHALHPGMNRVTLDLGHLSPGVLLARLVVDGRQASARIVKMRP